MIIPFGHQEGRVSVFVSIRNLSKEAIKPGQVISFPSDSVELSKGDDFLVKSGTAKADIFIDKGCYGIARLLTATFWEEGIDGRA